MSPLGIFNPSQDTRFCMPCVSIWDTHLPSMEGMLGDRDQVTWKVAEWVLCSPCHLGCRIDGNSPCFNRTQFPNVQRGPQGFCRHQSPVRSAPWQSLGGGHCGARRADKNCPCKFSWVQHHPYQTLVSRPGFCLSTYIPHQTL